MEHLNKYVLNKKEDFGNARDIRNFLDIAVSAQANRLLKENATSPEALVSLTSDDLAFIFEDVGSYGL